MTKDTNQGGYACGCWNSNWLDEQDWGDPWGCFAWSETRGERDEGILFISAYQVSQTKGTTAGQDTAYSQQINHMILEGDTTTLDPQT